PIEELPRIGRERLDVAPLPFRVHGVERERRLPRPADAGHDDQLAERQVEIEVAQIVLARAANTNRVARTRRRYSFHRGSERRLCYAHTARRAAVGPPHGHAAGLRRAAASLLYIQDK